MRKKQSPQKRQKPKARRRQAKAKNPPIVRTDADVLEESVSADESTQSGDTQGLPAAPDATLESVKELEEEGQYFEAEVVDAVENAPPADAGPVKTKEVPEDDVPAEYQDPDNRERQT
jgi:hypothetical protein